MTRLRRLLTVVVVALGSAAPAHAQLPPLGPWAVGGPVIVFPASAVNGGGVMTIPLLCADGTASAPTCGAFASTPTLGLYKLSSTKIGVAPGAMSFGFNGTGVTQIDGSNGFIQMGSATAVNWTNGTEVNTVDLSLFRDAADVLACRRGTNACSIRAYNTYTDASNYERGGVRWTSNILIFGSEVAGTGTARQVYLQAAGANSLIFSTNGNDRWKVDSNGALLGRAPTAGFGYETGAGGAITQLTSRTTGVTLNTVTGDITLFSAAGSATAASFTVTNSAVAATDNIIVNQKSGTDLYNVLVTNVAAGSFKVTFFTTGGVTVEQPVFHFSVIKGAIS